jgi:hypothetical protein
MLIEWRGGNSATLRAIIVSSILTINDIVIRGEAARSLPGKREWAVAAREKPRKA